MVNCRRSEVVSNAAGRRATLVGLVLTCGALVVGSPARALDPDKGISQYVHRVWGTYDGLPQGSITAFAQTPDGYLWMGTQEGLVRFDGLRFVTYDRSNTKELPADWITALHAGPSGALWVGTRTGLVRLYQGRFSSPAGTTSLPSSRITCLLEDRGGSVWIGTEQGLAVLRNGRVTALVGQQAGPRAQIHALLEDRQGRLWFGARRAGLGLFHAGRFTAYGSKNGLLSDEVLALSEDSEGGLWIGTTGGLNVLRDGVISRSQAELGDSSRNVSALLRDRHGSLWVGARAGGLSRLRDGRRETYAQDDGLSCNEVLTLFEDRQGTLWVGTQIGLNQFVDGRFTVYTSRQGLANDVVLAVHEDRSGGLWVGTTGGLSHLGPDGAKTYTTKDGLPGPMVSALLEDHAGTLWIGTLGQGLARMKDGVFRGLTTADGLSCNTIMCLFEDRDCDLWVGTSNGLNRLSSGKMTRYGLRDGLKSNVIVALTQGRDGSLWVGTDGGGLQRMQAGNILPPGAEGALADATVATLYEDGKGDLWIGTVGRGLLRLRAGRLSAYTRSDGLFSDSVFQILEDDRARLWMSCNRGVFRVQKEQLDDFAAGRTGALVSKAYGLADGIRSVECNSGSPAGIRTRDGRLLFATVAGLAAIDPARVPASFVPAPIVEAVSVDGEKSARGRNAEVGPAARRVEFRFAAVDLRSPATVRYRYRLEGFDAGWVDAGAGRQATYTNLAPGRYRFQASASSNDGVWSEPSTAWPLVAHPPFHRTPLFYGLCVLAIAASAAGIHRLRLLQLRARNAVLSERNRIGREIHDTVAQGLAGVVLQLETAESVFSSRPEAARGHLVRARELVRDGLDETRRAIAALRPRPLEKGSLPLALRALAVTMAGGTGIEVSVEVRGRVRPLAPEVEDDLWRIAHEALTNAIRHGKGRHVRVELRYRMIGLSLSVRDDGEGFAPASSVREGVSFGLAGMNERAERRRWRLTVASRPGGGTEVGVRVPLWLGLPWTGA